MPKRPAPSDHRQQIGLLDVELRAAHLHQQEDADATDNDRCQHDLDDSEILEQELPDDGVVVGNASAMQQPAESKTRDNGQEERGGAGDGEHGSFSCSGCPRAEHDEGGNRANRDNAADERAEQALSDLVHQAAAPRNGHRTVARLCALELFLPGSCRRIRIATVGQWPARATALCILIANCACGTPQRRTRPVSVLIWPCSYLP